MRVERATPADLPAIESLLAGAGLPLDGVGSAFRTGVVARMGGRVLAAAAVEPHGDGCLLRSVVVEPGHRGTGVGRAVVEAAEDLARQLGAREMYLLTETAAAWFPRLGYEVIARDGVPRDVRASIEFTTACAATAVAMRRTLGRP